MAAAPTLGHITAIEAMTPAFERTKKQLFQPFRFSYWWRLALTSLLAGEMGSGGGNWSNLGDLSGPGRSGKSDEFFFLAAPPWADWQLYLPLIAALVVLGLVLFVILIYVSSVFRFILFDSVLRERAHIREGWRRWQGRGGRFFVWQLGFTALMLLLAMVVGLPLFLAWRTGMFQHPDEHVGALILGGFLMFFVTAALVIAGELVAVFTRDFVVPLMALEELSATDAWRRLLPMLRSEKVSYAGYIGMKIVLAICSGILFGILGLIAMIIVLIPLVLVGIVLGVLAAALGLTWNPLTIVLAVLVGAVVMFCLFWMMAMVYVPAAVFFQWYTLLFFGSRYARLGALVTPPAPPAAAPAPA